MYSERRWRSKGWAPSSWSPSSSDCDCSGGAAVAPRSPGDDLSGGRRSRALVASLPDGWDTFVGEEGTMVSGGERRRIALARTFLADAPVVVLDEPTAHLDHETAERLIDDVLHATEGRTVLLITHRPEGLDAVDRIVRLRRGRVDQPGPWLQANLPNHIPRKG